MVLTDGFPVFAAPYSPERLAEYLQPIEPRWDGSHLTWTWFRYREQHIFWPWDRALPAHRADCDVPDLDFLYRGTIEMLESGENYPKIYASAFRHAGLAMIDQVTPPVCYGNRPGDSQHKTMRLYPPTAWVQEFPRDAAEAAVLERDILARHPAAGLPPPHRSRFGGGEDRVTDYLPTASGPTYAVGAGLNRDATPVLILHDLPGGADLHRAQIEALGADRPAIGFDFAGHANSVPEDGQTIGIDTWVAQIGDVLTEHGIASAHLYAHGTAAAVAVAFALSAPERVASLVMHAPPTIGHSVAAGMAQDYAPDITPVRDGSNFLRLWHHLRDQELWWPWFEQRRGNARPAPRIAPADLHARAVTMLKQPQNYRLTWQEILAYDLESGLQHLAARCLIVYREADIFAFARDPAACPLLLAEDEAAAAAQLAPWFAGEKLNSAADAATAPPSPAAPRAG
jgi:pimeloyl-ACP methyl ester carboxylesterase